MQTERHSAVTAKVVHEKFQDYLLILTGKAFYSSADIWFFVSVI